MKKSLVNVFLAAKGMPAKSVLVGLLVLGSSALVTAAKASPVATQPMAACGAPNIKFKVGSASPASAPASDAQQALFYFIEDDKHFTSTPKPTTREAIDGSWVGAMHGDSYFAIAVAPGEHHLCANWQGKAIFFQDKQQALLHVTAEPGRKYYFRVKNSWRSGDPADLRLEPIDSDEAQLLISNRRVSTFDK